MLIAICNYEQFKSTKQLLGAKFNVLLEDATSQGGLFTAYATDGGSLVVKFQDTAKPSDWDLLFGTVSVLCDGVSVN